MFPAVSRMLRLSVLSSANIQTQIYALFELNSTEQQIYWKRSYSCVRRGNVKSDDKQVKKRHTASESLLLIIISLPQ